MPGFLFHGQCAATLIGVALVRRGEVGVAVAMVALSALANLPRLLATPITHAVMHAALTCVVAVGLTWWALRYGRSLGRD